MRARVSQEVADGRARGEEGEGWRRSPLSFAFFVRAHLQQPRARAPKLDEAVVAAGDNEAAGWVAGDDPRVRALVARDGRDAAQAAVKRQRRQRRRRERGRRGEGGQRQRQRRRRRQARARAGARAHALAPALALALALALVLSLSLAPVLARTRGPRRARRARPQHKRARWRQLRRSGSEGRE